MKKILRNKRFILFLALIFISACQRQKISNTEKPMNKKYVFKLEKSESEWKKQLTSEQYKVLRESGTEMPFSGKYNLFFEKGIYKCAACGEPLFSSDAKFESHCGWPSFDKEIKKGKIVERIDRSHGMMRVEILCGNCGSHLGHVFNDGPTSTGLRYCVNSISLNFEEKE